jgi:hypothetical protein
VCQQQHNSKLLPTAMGTLIVVDRQPMSVHAWKQQITCQRSVSYTVLMLPAARNSHSTHRVQTYRC